MGRPFSDVDVWNFNATQIREFSIWAVSVGPLWFFVRALDVFSQLAELESIGKKDRIIRDL